MVPSGWFLMSLALGFAHCFILFRPDSYGDLNDFGAFVGFSP